MPCYKYEIQFHQFV